MIGHPETKTTEQAGTLYKIHKQREGLYSGDEGMLLCCCNLCELTLFKAQNTVNAALTFKESLPSSCPLSHHVIFFAPQPTNFTNPVYATLYMGAHNSRNSLASTDEKKELLSQGDEDMSDPLA